jgi:hypothetical protein
MYLHSNISLRWFLILLVITVRYVAKFNVLIDRFVRLLNFRLYQQKKFIYNYCQHFHTAVHRERERKRGKETQALKLILFLLIHDISMFRKIVEVSFICEFRGNNSQG